MIGARAARGVLVGIGLPLLAFSWAVTAQGTWETKAPDPHAKVSPSVAEIGGRLYVQGFDQDGGNQSSFVPRLSIFDPGTGSWTIGASPALIRAFAASAAINGKLYVVGGCLMSDCRVGTTNQLEIYNPATNAWSNGAPMPTPRWGTAAGVIGGKLYVTGGSTACPPCVPTNTTEIYDPTTNSWTTGAPIPVSRELSASAVINGLLYVIGGYERNAANTLVGAAVGTVSVYNPTANSWSTRFSMPTARSGTAAGVINGAIYVVGGNSNAPGYLATNEAYDPVTDSWTAEAPMSTARTFVAGGVVGSTLYVFDGTNGAQLATNEAFTPPDVVPPTTTATASTPANGFGWNNSDVTVTLAAVDNAAGSGVQSISYSLSGAQTGGATVPGASTAVLINTEGTTTITYHATDVAGNGETEQSMTIRLDKARPFLGVPNGISTNATSSAGAVVNFFLNASDGLSGLDGQASSQPKSSGETFPVGTTVETASVQDRAGNLMTATFSVTIVPSRPIVRVNGGSFVADGNPHPATAAATDFFNAPIAGTFTLAYGPGGPAAPISPGRYSATATFTSLDPAFTGAQAWTTKPSDPNAKLSPSVTEIGGRLYVLGFDQSSFVPRLSIFDPGTGAWSTAASPALVRAYASAAAINGKLYVVGGCLMADCRVGTTNQLEVYDPATNTWSGGASMSTARFGAAAGVISGRLYVTGGTTSCPVCVPTSTTEIYDPAGNNWTTGAAIPVSRELPASAVVNGLLYVIGGYERNAANTLVGASVGTVSVYNPTANSWSTRASMPVVRTGAAAGVVNNTIYVVGGSGSAGALATNEAYDPFSDSWTEEAPMITARYYVTGGVVNSTFYVVDGTNGVALGTNEAFDPSMTAHITITPPPNNPPFFVSPTPFAPLSVQATTPVGFTVRAADSNTADLVTVNVDGATMPAGASSGTTGPANPADRTFSWTPGPQDVGPHDIAFSAVDNQGSPAPPLTVRVNVTPPPVTLQSITVTPSSPTVSAGQNQTFQAIGHFSDGSTQTLPSGGGGGNTGPAFPIWSVHSFSAMDFSPCSTPQYPIGPGGFFAQAIIDKNGTVHETWSPQTPVVLVDGTINASDVSLSLSCTNGAASGSIHAHWTGTRYEGNFSFNNGASTGQVSITGWSRQTSMPTPRFALASAAVNGIVYAVGGIDGFAMYGTVEGYDAIHNAWITGLHAMPEPRSSLGVAALNGLVYAVGGQVAGGVPSGIVEVYDPVHDSWTTLPQSEWMPTARSSLALVAAGTKLYAIGGFTQSGIGGPVSTVESYDTSTHTWSTLASMPSAGGGLVAGVLDQTIVVVGSGINGPSASTVVYDIASNTWHAGTPMPAMRAAMAGATANGGLFVYGGTVSGSLEYQTWVYYPAANSRPEGWALVGSMPTARSFAAAAAVNDVVYAIGGMTGGNVPVPGLSTMEALSTPPFGDLSTGQGGSLPTVQWQSSNGSVASIDSSGSAHANLPGQTTIVASAGNISCLPGGCATLTVSDTTPPFMNAPGNQTRQATSPAGAVVTFFVSANDSIDGPRPVTCNPSSGSTFPFGTTTVNCSASDLSGNTAFRSFTITVQDTNPPFLNVPFQPWEATADSAAGVNVNYFVSASDSVDGTITPSCSPARGSLFPIGSTTVSCQATDAHGNSSPTKTFVVKVHDRLTVIVPSNITAEATSPAGAAVAFSVTATYFLGGSEPVQCFLITGFVDGDAQIGPPVSSGSTFPLGTSTVGCLATHSETGDHEGDFFTITVRDTTPPAVTTSGNVTLAAMLPTGAIATFTATATDLVDGVVPIACVPASGALFPIGTTTVTCSATDAHHNTRTATLSVTVLSPEEVTALLIEQIVNFGFEQSRSLLENVLKSLDKDNTGAACNQLEAFVNKVEAARGKSLTVTEANQLIQSANAARGALACR